jgi:hypothetical protein
MEYTKLIACHFENSTQQTNYSLCFIDFVTAYYFAIQPYF